MKAFLQMTNTPTLSSLRPTTSFISVVPRLGLMSVGRGVSGATIPGVVGTIPGVVGTLGLVGVVTGGVFTSATLAASLDTGWLGCF